MNKNWIKKEGFSQLILFFNGWGMDSSSINHLNSNTFDVIEFNDYQVVDFNENDYADYKKIYVIAWSLGVWAASYALENTKLNIIKAIAINGTKKPVDTHEGIPPEIFKGTIDGWNEKNRTRFLMRTIGGKNDFETHSLKLGSRSVENQKNELIALYNLIEKGEILNLKFNTALIGEQDAIFTPENQETYWKGKANLKQIAMPHYPFLKFLNWEEIIDM